MWHKKHDAGGIELFNLFKQIIFRKWLFFMVWRFRVLRWRGFASHAVIGI